MKLRDSLTGVNVSLALCAQTAPDLYFPEGVSGSLTQGVHEAKVMCFECPILRPCFESALRTSMPEDWGIWGGTTRSERATMRRRPYLLKEHQLKMKEAEDANQVEGEAA